MRPSSRTMASCAHEMKSAASMASAAQLSGIMRPRIAFLSVQRAWRVARLSMWAAATGPHHVTGGGERMNGVASAWWRAASSAPGAKARNSKRNVALMAKLALSATVARADALARRDQRKKCRRAQHLASYLSRPEIILWHFSSAWRESCAEVLVGRARRPYGRALAKCEWC